MAPRTRTTTARTAPAQSTSDNPLLAALATVQATDAAPVRASKEAKPIHTLDHVKASLDSGTAMEYTLTSEELVKEVKSDLQRAATKLGCGVSKSHTDNGDGTFKLVFKASAEKRERKYTSADIRAWAKDSKGLDIPTTGKIPDDVRLAYKIAHGFAKPVDNADDKTYAKTDTQD